jgi:hypothetical protein
MPATGVVQLARGPHDGERIIPHRGHALADRLFSVDLQDGTTYARTGKEFTDSAGDRVTIFEFDADGRRTKHAKVAFGRLPEDASCPGLPG